MSTRSAPRTSFWRRFVRALMRQFRGGRRYYDAGQPTSRLREFGTRSAGPNTITLAQARRLRDRARDMVRNDPHCARAIAVIVNNVVGTGITPTATQPEQTVEGEVTRADLADAVWRAWCEPGVADIEGQLSLDALINTTVRGWAESGEVLIRRRIEPRLRPVPWRLEVLEADMLDELRNEKLADGGQIVQGVELDARGRRVAYWILTQHPGEQGLAYGATAIREAVRVPASEIIHLFIPMRPRQVRGVPFLATVLATKKDLGDFESYELLRKKTETAVCAFVIPGDSQSAADEEDDEGLVPSIEDADGNTVEDMQGGLILRLRNGKEVRFNSPQIAANYDTYKRAMLQSIAVGCQISYEQLTGDLSQANYSSLRAGLLEFWRYIEQLQWLYLIPTVMQRLWSWAMEGAYMAGTLPGAEPVPVEWSAPRRQSVDPAKDTLADILDVRAGFVPLEDKIGERGYQAAGAFKRMAATNKLLEKFGLIVDTDPRAMAFRGAFPSTVAGTAAAAVFDTGDGTDSADRKLEVQLMRRLLALHEGTPRHATSGESHTSESETDSET